MLAKSAREEGGMGEGERRRKFSDVEGRCTLVAPDGACECDGGSTVALAGVQQLWSAVSRDSTDIHDWTSVEPT